MTTTKPSFALIFDIETNGIEKELITVVGEINPYKYICTFSTESEVLPMF